MVHIDAEVILGAEADQGRVRPPDVCHDIGLMVAYTYAQEFRCEVSHLAVLDAPLLGTAVFDRLRADARV